MYLILKDWKEYKKSVDYIFEQWCITINCDTTSSDEIENIKNSQLKELLKIEYKNIQTQIVEVKSEIKEIDDTYETYNETGKMIADKQKTILTEKLTAFRQQKDELVLGAIEKYWDEVLNEL